MTQICQKPFWEPWMSTESMFCQAVVKCGYLTPEQKAAKIDIVDLLFNPKT